MEHEQSSEGPLGDFSPFVTWLDELERPEREAKERAEALFASGKEVPITILPPELLQKIFSREHLDARDLAGCCRLSRDLLPIAQRALYSELEVRFVEDEAHPDHQLLSKKSQLIRRTLDENPALGEDVQDFTLWLQLSDIEDGTAQICGLDIGPVPLKELDDYRLPEGWVEANEVELVPVASNILSNLPRLRTLSLNSTRSVDFDFLLPLSFNRLTHLSMFPLNPLVLAVMPNLKSVDCSPPVIPEEAEYDVQAWPAPPCLKRLDIQFGEGFFVRNALSFLNWILHRSGASLQFLDISFESNFHFRFPRLSNLRQLKIRLYSIPDAHWRPSFAQIVATLPVSLLSLDISSPHSHSLSDRPADVEETYSSHMPPSLRVLRLDSHGYHPAAILQLLSESSIRLPHLKQFVLHGKPGRDKVWGMSWGSQDPLWTSEDWDKVVELCEEKGIACKV
ncbi:hypothetical protein JCM6882_001777 [Rhodosporidiobolus microsporus]